MMLRSLLISCLLSTCFPAGGRAQNTSQSGSDPITTVTVQSTITVVPIPYTSPTDDYLPASPTPTCDVGSVTCPVCDGENVDVDGGSTYKVHCDAGLSSNKTVLQPAYITPNQCLFVCETALDCVGTTLAANGSCVLTIGPDYRLSSSTGEIAFVQSEYIPSNSTSASRHANSASAKAILHQFHSAECNTSCELVYSDQQHLLHLAPDVSSLQQSNTHRQAQRHIHRSLRLQTGRHARLCFRRTLAGYILHVKVRRTQRDVLGRFVVNRRMRPSIGSVRQDRRP
jgi:hypothetical protein